MGMNQIPLPADWREQIQEAYNKFLAETMLAPDNILLPIGWSADLPVKGGYPGVPFLKMNFGFIEAPIAFLSLQKLAKEMLIRTPIQPKP